MTVNFEKSWNIECHYEGEDREDDGEGRSGEGKVRGDPTPATIESRPRVDPTPPSHTLLVMAENLSKVRARTAWIEPIIDINRRG